MSIFRRIFGTGGPQHQNEDLKERYANLSDKELRRITSDRDGYTPVAWQTAREVLRERMPAGQTQPEQKVVKAMADTTEAAFVKAQSKIPINAKVLEKKELTVPKQKVITVEAFDEQGARSQAREQISSTAKVKSVKLVMAGKKGFLGIGKTPNQYEAELLDRAVVEITYKTKAKILAKIGSRKQQVKIALKEWYKKSSGGKVRGGICDDCNSSLEPGKTYLRPGGYLCCESCTDAFLNADYIDWDQALKNLNRYFGPGIPKRIQDIAT